MVAPVAASPQRPEKSAGRAPQNAPRHVASMLHRAAGTDREPLKQKGNYCCNMGVACNIKNNQVPGLHALPEKLWSKSPDCASGPAFKNNCALYLRGMPALSTTSFHFLMSAVRRASASSGVLAFAMTPTLLSCSCTSGMARTSRIALFIVSMTSFGVSLGTPTPFQEITS